MLVDTQDLSEKPEGPSKPTPHSPLRVRSDLNEEYSADEIAKMTDLYEGTLSNIQEGEIVKSKVLRVTDTAVILDVGFKSEGAVAIDEFKDPHSLKEGDEVEVFLEHLEDQEGAVVLKKKADFMRCGTHSRGP
jgi:small subunit ribosomal protein S1